METEAGKTEKLMSRQEFEEFLLSLYDLERVLSEGEKGKVWLVRHKKLGRTLVARISGQEIGVYAALKTISHPNLVRVYDAIQLSDGFAELEEALNGVTVDKTLEGGLYRYGTAKKVLLELCQGLDYLHGLGIVHRDLKPSNVMVLKDGHCKLLDFDTARVAAPTLDTVRLGTPGYAAPEQYIGSSGIRTDIYALGVLLNIMLTGTHPSEALPRQGRARRIVLKATQIHPDKRFASAMEFAEAL